MPAAACLFLPIGRRCRPKQAKLSFPQVTIGQLSEAGSFDRINLPNGRRWISSKFPIERSSSAASADPFDANGGRLLNNASKGTSGRTFERFNERLT
ncbi:MAG: hypothetical protein ACTS5P_01565 [Candidatus Hodgkinia cicadicola]